MKPSLDKKILKKNWQLLVVAVLAVCFFIASSAFISKSQENGFVKWSSPDENANYVFTKLYTQTGELKIFEKYNLYADDVIHPRSFRSDDGQLKPVSFLGIILVYGTIAKLTTYEAIPYLTPFFASIGIIIFYLSIKKLFGRKNAFLSALLLVSFPPFFYYTTRSMMHNILFTVMLLMGLYFTFWMFTKNNWLNLFFSALSGFFIGLAVITRTSELLWLTPILCIMWIFNFKKVGLIKLLIFLSFAFLAILPVLNWNQMLYGGFFKGGYTEMNSSIITIASASKDLVKSTAVGELNYHGQLIEKIKNNIFYFGFHPRQALRMFYYYFVEMFPLVFWPAFLGLILFLQRFRKWKKKHFVYLLSLIVASAILVAYYGSWEFYDNPNKMSHTIGNSYVRYWLPIYLGAIPFFSMFLMRFTREIFGANIKNDSSGSSYTNLENNKSFFESSKSFIIDFLNNFKKQKAKKFLASATQVIIIILISFSNFAFLVYGSEEGLIYSLEKGKLARQEFQKVMELTENNSVIITQYHDKLFFGERKVIVGLFDNKDMVKKYARLTEYLPVYYYNFILRDIDIEYLNEKRLGEVGLGIELVERVGDFGLYRIFSNSVIPDLPSSIPVFSFVIPAEAGI